MYEHSTILSSARSSPFATESSPWLYLGNCWPWRIKTPSLSIQDSPYKHCSVCVNHITVSCVFWACLVVTLRGFEDWFASSHYIEDFQPKHASIWYQSYWLRWPENQEKPCSS